MGYKKIIPKHPGANSSNMTMVGIGVDDPTTNLDVLGDVRIRDSQGLFFKRHGDDYAWRMRNESSADATTHGFDGSNDLVFALVSNSGVITGSGSPPPSATSHTVYGNSANTLVLKETGNVGIGTSSPVAKLAVVGGTSNASDLATAYSLAAFNITPKITSGYSLAFGSGPGDKPYIQMSAGGTAPNSLLIQPYGGNVGIGTSIPSGRLTIANPTAYAPNTITAANTYIQLGSTDYGSGGASNDNGKFMIGFGYTDGVTNANSPAYIGFEETSTSGDTKGELTFYTRDVITDTAPTERMRIHDSGNVSIGSQADDNGILSVAANKGSAGDLWSQVGPNNNASLIIQNLSAVDNTNAVLYFANDAGVKAAINARFINHTTDETELRFSTTGSNGNSNEEIRFTNSGMTYGNAWHEVVFGGIANPTIATTVQVDIAAKTTGQVFKVEAIFNHWNSDDGNYTVAKKVKYFWTYSTTTSIVEHNDGTTDIGGSSVGAWTVDKPSNTRLRVTKSAGANAWPGEWYVRITSSCPITKV